MVIANKTTYYKFVKVGTVPTGRPAWDTRGPHELPEDWYPNFDGDKVRVGLHVLYDEDKDKCRYKVSVWGADDFGMAMFFKVRAEAEWAYNAIGDGVTREALYGYGFDND